MPVPGLRELQGLFWRSITGPPDAPPAPALLAVAEPTGTLSRAERLHIYADAYVWRLRDVLADDYPRVAAIVGAERFDALARTYLARHPSTHPSLRHLGAHLAGTVERCRDLPPYIADLARLEWVRRDVFDAPDCEPLGAEALRAVAPGEWPTLRLAPIRALRVLRLAWDVHEVWGGGDAPAAPSATSIRVWRGDAYRVYHAPMEPREADALARLIAGDPLERVCAPFGDLPPLEAAQHATALLARWLEDGIVARFG